MNVSPLPVCWPSYISLYHQCNFNLTIGPRLPTFQHQRKTWYHIWAQGTTRRTNVTTPPGSRTYMMKCGKEKKKHDVKPTQYNIDRLHLPTYLISRHYQRLKEGVNKICNQWDGSIDLHRDIKDQTTNVNESCKIHIQRSRRKLNLIQSLLDCWRPFLFKSYMNVNVLWVLSIYARKMHGSTRRLCY